jgi:hypothetical protein
VWKAIAGIVALVALVVQKLMEPGKPVAILRADQVLAQGLRKHDAALVATAHQMRHDATAELLRRWEIKRAKGGAK